MLEKGSYVPWGSHFMRHVDGKKEQGKMTRESIKHGPYVMKQIPYPTSPTNAPRTKTQTEAELAGDKKTFEADIDAMNMNFLGIPNYIYNYVDACQTAQAMNHVKRLMQGTNLSKQERDSSLTNEFDKFYAELANVNASRAARNHDPLALVTNTYASPSYSRSPQSYYVTHPPSVNDFDDDYQGEVPGDDQEYKLSTMIMLLARAIT
ncbi:hypothetical protein Tco_0296720 [Tanacetum coccineum]